MARYYPAREEASQKWLTTYKGSSFTKSTYGDPLVPEVPTGRRCIGDSWCWMVPFDADGPLTSHYESIHRFIPFALL